MKRRFQQYLVRTVIQSTFHVRVEYISMQKYDILPIQTNGAQMLKNLKTAPSSWGTWTPS